MQPGPTLLEIGVARVEGPFFGSIARSSGGSSAPVEQERGGPVEAIR